MASLDSESLSDRYVISTGHPAGGRWVLSGDEVLWLMGLCARLAGLRLELMRGLQVAISQVGGGEDTDEVKQVLTNLIIMQTRTADREQDLEDRLRQLNETGLVDGVPVAQASLTNGIEQIVEAFAHIQALAGSGNP